jgi:hypothetical protein
VQERAAAARVSPRIGAAPDARAPAASGEALLMCANTSGDRVVQRVVLPDGDAFVIARDKNHWSVGEGQRLPEEVLGRLENTFTEQHFFDFPEKLSSEAAEGDDWDLRLATKSRRHQSHNFSHGERDAAPYHAVFAACDQAFQSLPVRESDAATAVGVYRTLEDYAKTLPAHDPRRGMLLEWIDSQQADFVSP